MSADENRRLIETIFAGLAEGDGAPFLAHLAEDAVMTVTGESSWSGVHRGRAAILRDVFGVVSARLQGRNRTRAERIFADGDWVIVEARGEMTTADGRPYRNHYCLLYRLADGMIVEAKEYQDTAMCERTLGPWVPPSAG